MTTRPIKKIGEIAKTQSGGTPKRELKEFWGGQIPWLKSGELDGNLDINTCTEYITEKAVTNSSAKLFKKGTLLMAMYGATAGKLGILGMDATTNQAVCSIQNTKGLFDNIYVYYFLLLNRDKIIQDSFGGAQPNISKSYIDNIEIPLPSLDIQKAIVTKLDEAFAEIDEAISLTEGNISKTEEFKKSVLDKVFEDGEWKNKKMGDKKVLEIVDGDRGNNYPKKDEFLEDGYCLFLNTGNVRQGFFDLKDKQFITKEKDALLRKGKVKLDDVILTTRGTIGNSAHYDKNIEYTNVRINSGMVLLRSNKEVLMPEYLLKFITTPFFHKQRLAMASGSAQPQLPIGTLNNIEIPLPPLEDQAKIISYLDQVFAETSALKSDYETKLTHLKELKASILQSAFEGKLIAE